MTSLRAFASRLWGSLATRRRDAVLSEEIQTHLELLAEEFEARGMSRVQARLAARREFGGVEAIKESTRDERGWPLLDSLLQDVRFAWRQLRRAPSFTFAAICTLAIGIGGTTAVFSVINVVMLRPLPYPDADRLVAIQESFSRFGNTPVSAADADAWTRNGAPFEDLSLATGIAMNLTDSDHPEQVVAGTVDPGFLRLLGARPALGRLFTDDDNRVGNDRVVILGDAIWRRRFNADATIIGRSLPLDGVPHTVIGVLGSEFHAPNLKHLFSLPVREIAPDIWKPLALPESARPAIGGHGFVCLARLKPGIGLENASAQLAAIQAHLVQSIPGKGEIGTVVIPLQKQMGSRSEAGLLLLLLAVAMVLMIGCVNITNLLLSKTAARRKELAMREAVGAGRARIARQMVVENLVLASLGGLAGMALGAATLRLIVAIAPADIPLLEQIGLDERMLLVAALLTLGCGLLISLLPAWRTGGLDLQPSLKARVDAGATRSTAKLRSLLAGSEIGLSAACVAVAVLLLHSFNGLLEREKGFNPDRILTLDVNLTGSHYADAVQRMRFYDAVLSDIRRAPGVMAAAVASQLPLTGTGALSALSVEGTSEAVPERPNADVRSVTSDYFRAMQIPLKAGRLLLDADRDRRVAVLSEQLARRAWPGQDPLARKFRFGANSASIVYEVIGVVGDVRSTTLEQPMTLTAYVPFPQRTLATGTVLVKTSGDPSAVKSLLTNAVRAQDSGLPIQVTRAMDDVVEQSVAQRQFQLALVGLFALIASLLGALGTYGVLASAVSQQRDDIGIRLALGARPGTIVASVLRNALQLTLAGLAGAALLWFAAGRFLSGFLVGVSPHDPAALLIASLVVGVTALAASAVPAIRASRIDPNAALRND